MLLRLADRRCPSQLLPAIPQNKLFQIFSEYKRWGKIIGVSDIGGLNKVVEMKYAGAMIKISEALHEKKI